MGGTSADPSFFNCQFLDNHVTTTDCTSEKCISHGGAVLAEGTSSLDFNNCYFEGNSANLGGGLAATMKMISRLKSTSIIGVTLISATVSVCRSSSPTPRR